MHKKKKRQRVNLPGLPRMGETASLAPFFPTKVLLSGVREAVGNSHTVT